MSGLPSKIGAVGLAAGTAWLMNQSHKGSFEAKSQEHFAALKEKEEMADLNNRWGHYSGQPGMDNWVVKLKRLMARGVFDTKLTFQKYKMYAEGAINDVILPNAVPIAISAVGLGLAFRKSLSLKNLKRLGWIFNNAATKGAWETLKKGVRNSKNGMVTHAKDHDWGKRFSNVIAKNPLPILGGLGLAGFGLHRFERVYNGEEQQEFFHGTTNTVGH